MAASENCVEIVIQYPSNFERWLCSLPSSFQQDLRDHHHFGSRINQCPAWAERRLLDFSVPLVQLMVHRQDNYGAGYVKKRDFRQLHSWETGRSTDQSPQ